MKHHTGGRTTRRDILAYSGALLGLGFVSATPETSGAALSSFDVRTYGATGVRKDNATKAFRDAIAACTAAGGGTVLVPAGDYTVGTVQLRDNVTLHLEAGSTLFASQAEADY